MVDAATPDRRPVPRRQPTRPAGPDPRSDRPRPPASLGALGPRRIALLAACLALAVASGLAITAPEPAEAFCDNGTPYTFFSSFALEEPVSGTCNWDGVYRGISRDIRTDGSCVWVQFADTNGTNNYGWACTTSGTLFTYWDPTPSAAFERLCKNGTCSVWWGSTGY
ncbi:MAG TPA: hypothetical protein VFZ68_11620 [Acidimicrobiales bacterium]